MRGWTSSSSIERRRSRSFEGLAATKDEVVRAGRAATAEPVAPGSFHTRPHDVAALTSFDDGVAAALRRHFASQGLVLLADQVDDLVALGSRVRDKHTVDHSVSAVVYQMH